MKELYKYINEGILDDEDVFLDNMDKALLLGSEWELSSRSGEFTKDYANIFNIKKIDKEYKKLKFKFEDSFIKNAGKYKDLSVKYYKDNLQILDKFLNIFYNMSKIDLPKGYEPFSKLGEFVKVSYIIGVNYDYFGELCMRIGPKRPGYGKAVIILKFKKRK